MRPIKHPQTLDQLSPRARNAVERWAADPAADPINWVMAAAAARTIATSPRYADDPVLPRLLVVLADRCQAMASGRNAEKRRRLDVIGKHSRVRVADRLAGTYAMVNGRVPDIAFPQPHELEGAYVHAVHDDLVDAVMALVAAEIDLPEQDEQDDLGDRLMAPDVGEPIARQRWHGDGYEIERS